MPLGSREIYGIYFIYLCVNSLERPVPCLVIVRWTFSKAVLYAERLMVKMTGGHFRESLVYKMQERFLLPKQEKPGLKCISFSIPGNLKV